MLNHHSKIQNISAILKIVAKSQTSKKTKIAEIITYPYALKQLAIHLVNQLDINEITLQPYRELSQYFKLEKTYYKERYDEADYITLYQTLKHVYIYPKNKI